MMSTEFTYNELLLLLTYYDYFSPSTLYYCTILIPNTHAVYIT